MVNLTEYAVHTKHRTVVIRHINRNRHITLFKTSVYSIMVTVAGINKIVIFFRRKSERDSTFSSFTILNTRHKNRISIAITLPGNGSGKKYDIISPIKQITKITDICFIISKIISLPISSLS